MFGPRLQPTSIAAGTLLSLVYNYGSTNNNGNVVSQQITAGGFSATQNYQYDGVNRLTGMNETSGWSESFIYDPYGNRTGGSSSSPYMPLQIPAINGQTNKISAANHSYDAAGNLVQGIGADGFVKTYSYDAENRLINFSNGTATYVYDGDGRRVMKSGNSATTVFVYDARGQMVAEYSNQAPTTSGGTSYLTADHLGSTRLVTDSTGTVIARHDYAPFGEEISSVIGGRSGVTGYGIDEGLRQKFTAKERDTETGLDNFGARYFGSSTGRFMSPDPLLNSGRPDNPQTWNRYAYTLNNPLKFFDPTGLYVWEPRSCGIGEDMKCSKQYEQSQKKFRDALKNLEKARDSFKKESKEYNRLDAALKAFGAEGQANGVSVGFDVKSGTATGTTTPLNNNTAWNVTFHTNNLGSSGEWAFTAGHEGTHVDDFSALNQNPTGLMNVLTPFSIEYRGYETSVFTARGLGYDTFKTLNNVLWNSSWKEADKQTLMDKGITNTVKQVYGHPETQPHNPLPN
jgi:RHS repeat-associated protein